MPESATKGLRGKGFNEITIYWQTTGDLDEDHELTREVALQAIKTLKDHQPAVLSQGCFSSTEIQEMSGLTPGGTCREDKTKD